MRRAGFYSQELRAFDFARKEYGPLVVTRGLGLIRADDQRGYLTRSKSAFGYQTGDLIKATVPKGKYQGERVGRVTVRASSGFNVNTVSGTVTVSHKHCRLLQPGDGYEYSYR